MIFVVYLFVAVASLLSQSLSNVLSLVAGGVVVAMAYSTLGGRPENRVSFGVRLVIVFVAGLISGVIIIFGLLFLVVPGIYLSVRLRLVTAAVMLDDCGPIEALGRSFDLTEGHTWTVFGVALLLSVVSLATTVAVGLAIVGAPSEFSDVATLREVLRIGAVIPTLLITPIGVSADAVMYGLYD